MHKRNSALMVEKPINLSKHWPSESIKMQFRFYKRKMFLKRAVNLIF